ncbi:MAG TPA: hypothetical protein VGL40_03410 [Bacillota bacterium]
MSMDGIKLDISTSLINDIIKTQIQAAIMQELGKDPQGTIRAVVDAALQAKQNSYDRETIFHRQVRDMIQGAASEAFKEWLATNKRQIKKAVAERIKAEEGPFLKSVADRIVEGMGTSLSLRVTFQVPD